MNKKHKNKNRSKPINPIPPTENVVPEPVKEEVSSVLVEEKLESVIEKSESVFETVCEMSVPITEEYDSSINTPKKPKRNKGRKKKHEDLDLDDNKSAPDEVLPSIVPSEAENEAKSERKADIIQLKVEEENVTPNVRKKKNKKKQNEEVNIEEPSKAVETNIQNIEDVQKEEIIADLYQKSETPTITDPDTRQPKKKNKKKKHRHDSEKSDKVDETVACTSAFQNIICVKDNEDKIKTAEITEQFKNVCVEDSNMNIPVKEDTLKDLIQSVLLVENANESEKLPEKVEPPKGKKKSKKEKQQQHKVDTDEVKITEERIVQQEFSAVNITDNLLVDISKNDFTEDEEPAIKSSENESADTMSKPKAKIAKPVEKKSKKKIDCTDIIDKKIEEYSVSTVTDKAGNEKPTEEIKTISAIIDTCTQKLDESFIDEQSVSIHANTIIENPSDSIISTEEVRLKTETPIIDNVSNLQEDPNNIKITAEIIDMGFPVNLSKFDEETGNSSNKPPLPLEEIGRRDKEDTFSDFQLPKNVEKRKKKYPKQIDTSSNIPKTDIIDDNKILVTSVSEPKIEESAQKQTEDVLLEPSSAEEGIVKSIINTSLDPSTSDKDSESSLNQLSLPLEKQVKDIYSDSQLNKPVERKKKKHSKQIDIAGDIPTKTTIIDDNKILFTPESEPKMDESSQKRTDDLLLEPSTAHEGILESDNTASICQSLYKKDLECSSNKSSLLSEQKQDKDFSNDVHPDKPVERKKKKPSKQIDILSNITKVEKIPDHKILVTPESELIKDETPHKKIEDLLFESSPGELEISSLKTDDVEGSSDVTPDFIQHPLATSQHLTDDNNNMFIREITSTDEKLGLPIIIPTEPIIQGSGETPEPESILMGPTIIPRERTKISDTEKTDLKSKMIEVSQDMEELRLSIERSLAELTSMEKTEEEIEKRFEQTTVQQTTVQPTTVPPLGIATEPVCAVQVDITSEKNKCNNDNLICDSNNTILIQDTKVESKAFINITPQLENPESSPNRTENIQVEKTETPVSNVQDDQKQVMDVKEAPPVAPVRKDHKGKGKGKKKSKQESQTEQTVSQSESSTATTTESKSQETQEKENPDKQAQHVESNQNSGKQQAMQPENEYNESEDIRLDFPMNIVDPSSSYEPIENFEDALTSSVDDVNKTFEMIAHEVNNASELSFQNPEINVIEPKEETEAAKIKENPVTPPKNLLGHPDIPVESNKTDYKKEKNKPPNMRQAKVKIKDAVDIEKVQKTTESKESQTDNKRKLSYNRNVLESFSYMTNDNAEYVYKYSFRKVFLQSLCHVCRKELSQRVPCQFCSLVFYCSQKHKDDDWPQHQALCFAVCTIVHLKDQKHIYADAKHITGHNYRLLRMQMIISCEKVLKRKLVPWEQEAFLYPRICADVGCRQWRQSKLVDCGGCGQVSYCSEHPDHLPATHQRWCRSYALYQKLVHHQQTKGRLEPKLPTKVMAAGYRISEKINEVLASMYDEKIDLTDAAYAALTQLATAPLTTAHCHQRALVNSANGISKKTSFVIHIVGAELQFEADVLFKWELFFLHLKPDVKELRVVLVSPDLNPSNLPLDLLKNVNLCESCNSAKRRVIFSFQDKMTYYQYWSSDEFHNADIVCAFNASIQRSSVYNGKDTWPTTVSCILKLKTPFVISSYSIDELHRDIAKIKECSQRSGLDFKTICEPAGNPFASVRPDRNFITDDEIPLLFKNYCFAVLCGV